MSLEEAVESYLQLCEQTGILPDKFRGQIKNRHMEKNMKLIGRLNFDVLAFRNHMKRGKQGYIISFRSLQSKYKLK